MPIIEEIVQFFQNIHSWFASFTDIGDMFVKLWEGFVALFQ
jgi:hypothetical protein